MVCLQIHGMVFKRPIKLGEVIAYESRIVLAGRTSLVANIRVKSRDEIIVDGFITFINVDMDGAAQPHGIVLEPNNDEELALQAKAQDLSKTR